MLANRLEAVIAVLAIARLGAAVVLIGTRLRRPEIEYIVADSQAEALIYETEFERELPSPDHGPSRDMRFCVGAPSFDDLYADGAVSPPPIDAYRNPKTGAQDSAARGHAEKEMAREVGMPGGYDVGTQRVSWFGHLVTNWAGDDGFIRRLNVTVKRPNIFGDVSWCRGTVVDKRVEEGAHLVELEVRIENQLGDVTADGTSIVELPAARPGA